MSLFAGLHGDLEIIGLDWCKPRPWRSNHCCSVKEIAVFSLHDLVVWFKELYVGNEVLFVGRVADQLTIGSNRPESKDLEFFRCFDEGMKKGARKRLLVWKLSWNSSAIEW